MSGRGGHGAAEERIHRCAPLSSGTITVAASGRDGQIVREVRDIGTGKSAEVRERACEPFFTTRPAGQGTGLGLSVCHGIVRSRGASIEAESGPGRGTTMRIRPRAHAE